MPAWAKVAVLLVVVIVIGSAGTAAYIVLGAKSRFVGTWKIEKIEAGGMSFELDKMVSAFGGLMGMGGGASATPPEALITLNRDGTGKVTSSGGLLGGLTPGGASSEDLKWSYQGGKITVESSGASGMGGMVGTGDTPATGELKQGKLILSFEDPASKMTGSLTCSRKKK